MMLTPCGRIILYVSGLVVELAGGAQKSTLSNQEHGTCSTVLYLFTKEHLQIESSSKPTTVDYEAGYLLLVYYFRDFLMAE